MNLIELRIHKVIIFNSTINIFFFFYVTLSANVRSERVPNFDYEFSGEVIYFLELIVFNMIRNSLAKCQELYIRC